MRHPRTILILPPNDPEAVMIYQIAKALGIQMIVSRQPHGASLDRESDVVPLVKAGGWQRVIIVEMPGPKTEAQLRRNGIEVKIIDHHHYTGLDRARDPKTQRLLPSSLEQFLKLFRVSDAKLKALGFDPRLVRGIGVMDRGFVWALREEGWSTREIKRVLAYQKELMRMQRSQRVQKTQRSQREEQRKDAVAREAWRRREKWGEFWVVESASAVELRPRISLMVALEIGKPTPLIIVEKKRGLIYVQESSDAMKLFHHFGGFTFGMDRCWGYKSERGKRRVGLQEVKRFLEGI